MQKQSIIVATAFLLGLVACNQPQLAPEAQLTDQTQEILSVEAYEAQAEAELQAREERSMTLAKYDDYNRGVVYLPAGSVDGLQAAIQQAGPWGKVILKSGLHIENTRIHITHPVRIIGQNGAILQSNAVPVGFPSSFPFGLNPAIFIENANFVRIQNLKIVPDPSLGYGEVAIAAFKADYLYIRNNDIQDFGGAVQTEKSNYLIVRDNHIEGVASDAPPLFSTTTIFHYSGRFPTFFRNDVNDFNTGFFVCDRNGILLRNTANNGVFGYILCRWPIGFIKFPNDSIVGAALSSKQWLVVGNQTDTNNESGYLITDGATQNILVNNRSLNAGAYDFDFRGDAIDPDLGLLPRSSDNLFIEGRPKNVSVKDCGDNNTIIGGNLVDPTVDPCL